MSTNASHKNLARSAGIIGALTGFSRILGFIRDMVIAAAFGTGLAAEAFVVSFRIPNLLRDLVGEGATNAAFVPVLSECREKQKEHFWGLVCLLFTAMAAVLAVLTVLGMVFTPQIVSLIAPGFTRSLDAEKYPLTITLTRAIFPYIFLIGLSALAMGVLNSLQEFTSSAFGPVLLNICMIISGLFFEKYYGPMALVIAVLIGGVLQLAWQIPPLLKFGFRWTKPSAHGYAAKIGKLLLPRALGSAIYQINIFVDSILASFEAIVGSGAQSALYYANRLFQLPLAIFGISLAQAILPVFSIQYIREDKEGFKDTISGAIRSLLFIIIPASAGLAVFSESIIRILFQRGHFDEISTGMTSSALYYYAFGLLSCCLVKILANAFYAMQDTRTPVRTMAFSVTLNIVLSLILMHPLKIGGLSLASSLSATVNATLLYYLLRKKIGSLHGRRLLSSIVKVALASGLMALAALYIDQNILQAQRNSSTALKSISLAVSILVCIAVYFVTCLFLRLPEAKKIVAWRR